VKDISELRDRRYAFLSEIAGISKAEANLFHFDGELFYPNFSKNVSIYNVSGISLTKIEAVEVQE